MRLKFTLRGDLGIFFVDLSQGSNDIENWTTLATLGTTFVIGFALPAAVTGFGVSYLRLSHSIGGEGGLAIVAAGVNLTNL